jgi:pimeloyl-ACP methyl ester carboxylesterase
MLVQEHFSARGYDVSLPSISVPSLAELSPRAAVDRVKELIRATSHTELTLMGSSFGAFVGLHAYHELPADERAHIRHLVLLAPALDPWDPRSGLLTTERERLWRERGSAPVLNLESGTEVPVHYRFVEELRAFDLSGVTLAVPTLLIHGIDDEVVPCGQSQDFAASRPGVSLILVQDSHQLLGEPLKMLNAIERFIISDSPESR